MDLNGNLAPGEQDIQKLQSKGYTEEDISDWRADAEDKFRTKGYSEDDIKDYFGTPKDPSVKALEQPIKQNIDVKQTQATGVVDSFMHGLQMSNVGLIARQKMPTQDMSAAAPWYSKFSDMAGQTVGDLPTMAFGGLVGAPAGPAGIAAGAFAAPAVVRRWLIDEYQKGAIQSPRDAASRVMDVAWDGLKVPPRGLRPR